MPGISTIASGPTLGNRFSTEKIVNASNDVMEQMSLKATINRVNKVRESYDSVVSEGARAGASIKEKGKVMASTGAERAQQLRGIVEEGVSDVTNSTSKSVGNKTALVQARNQPTAIETGKGANVSTTS